MIYKVIVEKYAHINDFKPHFFTLSRKAKELLFSSSSDTSKSKRDFKEIFCLHVFL